ncbi:prepilin-type cleavage/methylation domain-containing protein [Shewanella sp. Choline-02u-19]|uniref:type IV pilin protein n=1 Tax=unclassified Shewanella TaxID=196818 RepID=UPI000C33E574|nr:MULTISPECIES: type IV pilin protein [unclassified Shewanella]PKG57176.1 prepilin-type cleavage/methylation domain-containing protein [Shewanella sp. GutDb-MelDb]PKH57535.1 prepilin-type cleavage/methylation domain-containing protein [Shewanella sp. Bg11-22]PKI28397.1 prepilin-type cleavage/methylation domain-containing protein [Shewanella sp. Choline-02u-19]
MNDLRKLDQHVIHGFTLIELMIVVAIIGILAAIAYPSYTDYVTKAGRSDGVTAVLNISNLQEQYYLDNRAYTTDLTKLGLSASYVTENGHYSVASTGGDSFTITASAEGAQKSRDSTCQTITLTDIGVKGPSAECWK